MTGKRVLITGGSERIGAVIADAFADAGAEVIIHSHSRKTGPQKYPVLYADFTQTGSAEKLMEQAGKIDILVNNASLYRRCPFQQERETETRELMEVNFFAPLALMKAFAAACSGNDGVIINILDQAVFGYAPDSFGYLAGKQALMHATESAALAYAPRIRVNGIAPGPMIPPKGLEHSRMEQTLKRVPLGRPVSPEDLAAAVLFLAENHSVTGAVLALDGGQHLFETHHP